MWILCNNCEKTLVYLKPHDAVQRPRVNRYGLMAFLCIFWNNTGVLHDRLLKMSLMKTPYVKHHKLIKYCSLYGKSSKNWGRWRLQDIARKHTTNRRKTALLHWIVTPYSFNMASNDEHRCHSLQQFLAEKKCLMKSKRWKFALLIILPKQLFFYYSCMHVYKSVRKTFRNRIVLTLST